MSETMFLIFELIGTVAFAASGAITGIGKKMDILGVATLGIVTAVGGGVIRDLILGITPPATFSNPIYAIIALIVSVIIFIPAVHRFLFKNKKVYDFIMLLMDSAGLGIFTVVGIQTAMHKMQSPGIFLLIFVGMVTGIGGGVLRDVMLREIPFVLKKRIYALASIAGGTVYYHLHSADIDRTRAIVIAVLVTFVIRVLATIFRLDLPKVKLKETK